MCTDTSQGSAYSTDIADAQEALKRNHGHDNRSSGPVTQTDRANIVAIGCGRGRRRRGTLWTNRIRRKRREKKKKKRKKKRKEREKVLVSVWSIPCVYD
jgi:hypothetical protein